MVSSILTKEQQQLVQPDENMMFYREGFDRPSIRRELSPVTPIDAGTRYVRQGNARYVHPDSDMPEGPTSTGETFGNIELVQDLGQDVEIPRYTHGFTFEQEDGEVDSSYLTDLRNSVMELFDLRADLSVVKGLEDEYGNTVFPDIFTWLDDNMPSSNVIDCTAYADQVNSIPANIIKRICYENVTGEYATNQWDMAIAKHSTWAKWNELGTFDGIPSAEKSQWALVEADNDDASVGINRRVLIPETMGLRAPADMDQSLSFTIDTIGDDEMYIVPNHGGDFYELYEQGTPDPRGPLPKEGYKERYEYKWRGGLVYGFSHRSRGSAPDTFKLTNVSALFDQTA